MKIYEYSTPRPHIIIKNIFPKSIIKKMFLECVKLDKEFKDGFVQTSEGYIEDKQTKFAKDLFLDKYYKNNRVNSEILKALDNTLWNTEMRNIYDDSRYPIFNTINHTTKDETHLIRYSNNQFYNWHKDLFVELYSFCTINLFIGKEKKYV